MCRIPRAQSSLLASLAFARLGTNSRCPAKNAADLRISRYWDIKNFTLLGCIKLWVDLDDDFYIFPFCTDVFFSQPGFLSLGDKLMKAAPKRGRGDGFLQGGEKTGKRREGRRSWKE